MRTVQIVRALGLMVQYALSTVSNTHWFDMHNSKPVSTPVNSDIKLVVNENPDDVCNQQMYQAIVESLFYLSTKTRLDIAYAVSSVARFCSNPTKEHCTTVKRIL